MKLIQTLLLVFAVSITARAAKADTIEIYSNSMHKYIKAVVIKPAGYHLTKSHYPVVYLLHGYDGDYSNWIVKVPELKDHADTYQTIIVCPDGAISSWYFNSPVDSAYRYETHISKEVVNHIDKNYRTIADRNHRAITGLSMGGHGALFIGLRHSNTFGAAGSLSGALDIKGMKNSYDIIKRIGDTLTHAADWDQLSLLNMIDNYKNTGLHIIFDCGIKDPFINANRQLHLQMLKLNIAHTYTERPGNHGWDYWRTNIGYHLLYFKKYFSQNQ